MLVDPLRPGLRRQEPSLGAHNGPRDGRPSLAVLSERTHFILPSHQRVKTTEGTIPTSCNFRESNETQFKMADDLYGRMWGTVRFFLVSRSPQSKSRRSKWRPPTALCSFLDRQLCPQHALSPGIFSPPQISKPRGPLQNAAISAVKPHCYLRLSAYQARKSMQYVPPWRPMPRPLKRGFSKKC